MSASWIGNMSTPRVKVPLLLLTAVLLGTGFGQGEIDKATEQSGSGNNTVTTGKGRTQTQTHRDKVVTNTSIVTNQTSSNGTLYEGSASGTVAKSIDGNSTDPTESPGLDPIIIIIPAVLVVVIICMIVCGIFINHRWNKQKRNRDLSKEDPYLDESSTEKVPMPMFEEDVPSVLELEMEDLDEWMKKDGETAEDSKCL